MHPPFDKPLAILDAPGMGIPGYSERDFTHEGVTKKVYRKGSGPGVIVITEVPGIHPGVIDFANILVDSGFTVLVPEIMGTTGKPVSGCPSRRQQAASLVPCSSSGGLGVAAVAPGLLFPPGLPAEDERAQLGR